MKATTPAEVALQVLISTGGTAITEDDLRLIAETLRKPRITFAAILRSQGGFFRRPRSDDKNSALVPIEAAFRRHPELRARIKEGWNEKRGQVAALLNETIALVDLLEDPQVNRHLKKAQKLFHQRGRASAKRCKRKTLHKKH